MYLDYFGFKQKPFLITPDPAFLYPSDGHQQALAHLQYGLQREGGFLLLTGEVGTGKTTLCRHLIDNLPSPFRLAYILNTRLDTNGVLAGICHELGVDLEGKEDTRRLVDKIYANLLVAYGNQQQTLVIIEEAQNLTPEVLETLRLLTNLETATTKLLHILLVGQPELLETLYLPELRQLNQRIVARSHLEALSRDELAPYFLRRLSCAGTSRPLFSRGALNVIYAHTKGIPRLVNLLAEHCLLGAYAANQSQVCSAIARRAVKETQLPRRRSFKSASSTRWSVVVVFLCVIVTAAGAAGFLFGQGLPVVSEPSPALDVVTIEHPMAYPSENVFTELLSLWGVSSKAASRRELCQIAESQKLRCVTQDVESLDDILILNRPMVIELSLSHGEWQYFLLEAISDEILRIRNRHGERQLTMTEFGMALPKSMTYLWRPLTGYRKPIVEGTKKPELVSALIDLLQDKHLLPDHLLTGGVYNALMVTAVRQFQAANGLLVDGVVGDQTLLKLLEGSQGEPTLMHDVEL